MEARRLGNAKQNQAMKKMLGICKVWINYVNVSFLLLIIHVINVYVIPL